MDADMDERGRVKESERERERERERSQPEDHDRSVREPPGLLCSSRVVGSELHGRRRMTRSGPN